MSNDCIFCQIAKGESPAHVIWEDEKHIAFLDIFPNTDGFTILATKKHHPSYIFDVDEEIRQGITKASQKVAKLLDQAFEDVGRTGLMFEGTGVDHLHAKLFPMHGTSHLQKDWQQHLSKDSPFFEKYEGFITSNTGPKASQKKLKNIAEKIRSAKK